MGVLHVHWRVRAIRGATTVPVNSKEAIAQAVTELLDALERHNRLDLEEVVSVTFSVTRDLDAVFPAAIARQRPGWDQVPLMDFQHMYVAGSLERCIRILVHFNCPEAQTSIYHPYLRHAADLRPDLALPTPVAP